MPLPHAILRRLLVRRGLTLWLLARLMLLVALVLLPALAGRVVPPPAWRELLAAPQMLPFLAALVWVDLHRRRETTLLANLGHTQGGAVLVACVPGILLEGVALAMSTTLPV